MSRPIFWALGVLGSAALSALSIGPRLEKFTGQEEASAPPAAPGVKPPFKPGPRLFSIAADYRGHYTVHPTVKNLRLRMLVDTGASVVALTDSDARSLGLKLLPGDPKVRMNTANGSLFATKVWLDELTIGDITVRNIEAVVMPKGALETSLLGMTFLKRLSGFEIASGRLTLKG